MNEIAHMQSGDGPRDAASVMFGGDVMLGRWVGERIAAHGPAYPLGPVAALLRRSALTVVNLECALTASGERWKGAPKAFYFGGPPQGARVLSDAGVDVVSLANNHALDFGPTGLSDTLRHLRRHGVLSAGAGVNLRQARTPLVVERAGLRFGIAAFCDHQADFAATKDTPGIAWLDLDDERAALETLQEALQPLRAARADWPVLSLHWGPNFANRPSAAFRRIAHAAVEMGWKILYGHSAHVFQGIEVYRGCPILYAAGDLVDDYHVDLSWKNDHQLLVEIVLDRTMVLRIELHPVLIADCQVRPATGAAFEFIANWMTEVCKDLGTPVRRDGQRLWIALADPP